MNPFVDPSKRGVSLPEGCKDLSDLLALMARPRTPKCVPWTGGRLFAFPRLRDLTPGELPEVVRVLFEAGPQKRSAILCTPGERELISLGWNKTLSAVQAILCFPGNPRQKAKARRFLEVLGKKPSQVRREQKQLQALPVSELLAYKSFAASELELNILLRRFIQEFLNLPPDSRLNCVLSRGDPPSGGTSGTAQN